MNRYLRVLSGNRLSSAVELCHDTTRLLFNAGENVQRIGQEHGQRSWEAQLQRIYLTHLDSSTVGGLVGLLLQAQELNNTQLQVHGPRGTKQFLQQCKLLMMTKAQQQWVRPADVKFDVAVHEWEHGSSTLDTVQRQTSQQGKSRKHKHAVIEVEALLLDDNTASTALASMPSVFPPSAANAATLVAYLVTLPQPEPRVDANKAKHYNVNSNRMFQQLFDNGTVESTDSTTGQPCTVTLADICLPSEQQQERYMYVHIPASATVDKQLQALDKLSAHASLMPYRPGSRLRAGSLSCVVHHVSPALLNAEVYQQFVESFGSKTQHLISSSEDSVNLTANTKSLFFTAQLARLATGVGSDAAQLFDFHKAATGNTLPPGLRGMPTAQSALPLQAFSPDATTQAQLNSRVDAIRRSPHLDATNVRKAGDTSQSKAQPSRIKQQTLLKDHQTKPMLDHDIAAHTSFQPHADGLQYFAAHPDHSPCVTFLGTGSSISSVYRNVAGICIELASNPIPFESTTTPPIYVLDCGEGSYSQMCRKWGAARADDMLTQLQLLFVSHAHNDHCAGVVALLQRRAELYENRRRMPTGGASGPTELQLIAPESVIDWLTALDRLFASSSSNVPSLLRHVHLVNSKALLNPYNLTALRVARLCGLTRLQTIVAIHSEDAYSVVLECQPQQWKVVYSGDTQPNQQLVAAGSNATLLIHEATLEDSMQCQALKKQHSTIASAVAVGVNMRATCTMLTHFSQRYSKTAPPSAYTSLGNKLKPATCVGLAYDLLSVRLHQLEAYSKLSQSINHTLTRQERAYVA